MDTEQFPMRDAPELLFVGVVIPVAMALYAIVLIAFEGAIAMYAGMIVGIGLVLLGGIVRYRENQRQNSG